MLLAALKLLPQGRGPSSHHLRSPPWGKDEPEVPPSSVMNSALLTGADLPHSLESPWPTSGG